MLIEPSGTLGHHKTDSHSGHFRKGEFNRHFLSSAAPHASFSV